MLSSTCRRVVEILPIAFLMYSSDALFLPHGPGGPGVGGCGTTDGGAVQPGLLPVTRLLLWRQTDSRRLQAGGDPAVGPSHFRRRRQ